MPSNANHDPVADGGQSHQLPTTVSPAGSLGPVSPTMPWIDSAEGSEGIRFTGLIHSLRRRWLPATGLGILLATLFAGLLWAVIPVEHEAISILRVRRENELVFSQRRTVRSTIQDYMTYKETQATLLKSSYVVSAALRDPNISQLPMVVYDQFGRKRKQAIAWLEDELKVDLAGESEILQIRLRGENQQQTQAVLDAVVKAYMDEIVYSELIEKRLRLDTLTKKYRENGEAIREKSDQANRLAEQLGSTNLETVRLQHQAEFEKLRSKKLELDKLRANVNEVEVELAMRSADLQMGQSAPSQYAIEDELDKDPQYFQMGLAIRELEEQIRFASERYRPGSPQLQQLTQELGYLTGRREELRAELTPRAIDRIRRVSGETAQVNERNLTLQSVMRQQLLQKVALATEDYNQQADKFNKLGGYSGDLDARMNELKSLKMATEELKMEMDSLGLDLENPSRIKVIQSATVPDESNWLLKIMEIGGAWAVTFGCVVAGVAYWDYLGKRVNSTQDVTSGTSARVVGSLPTIQSGGLLPFRGVGKASLESALNYSIDGIRTALLYNRSGPVQVAMITSAGGHEGRTTVASQLAVSMARSGRRTLLIDADLRSPQQHNVFSLANDFGTSELLRRQTSADDAIQPTAIESLWLLPAGQCDQASIRALSSDYAHELFQELRSRFDTIVVDAAPVLTGADALLLGQHADVTLISVRRDVSQLPKVNAACDRLESVGVHVMGVVVNGGEVEIRQGERRLAAPATSEDAQPALTS